MDGAQIEKSFELAAERFGDIAPQVYGRLFDMFPEMQALFVRDTHGQARGEMLARAIEVIFDLLGQNHYGGNFIRAEVVTHEGYGVPRDIFAKFFDALAATLKDLLAADWTPAMEENWNRLVNHLSQTAADGLEPPREPV